MSVHTEVLGCDCGHEVEVEYEIGPAEPSIGISHAYVSVVEIQPCTMCGGTLDVREAEEEITEILHWEAIR